MTDDRDALLERTRTHIKAVMKEIKEQSPGQLAQPAGLFMSGMLTGLAAGIEILGGGTAEQSLETVHTRLAAAIGEAYLAGTLPATPAAEETHVVVGDSTDPEHVDDCPGCAQQVRGVQASLAADLHQALGHPLDATATAQGHASWSDWWAHLIGQVAQRTRAEAARLQTEVEGLTSAMSWVHGGDAIPQYTSDRRLAETQDPDVVLWPTSYGAVLQTDWVMAGETLLVVDLRGYSEGDPLMPRTLRLVFHRALAAALAAEITGQVPLVQGETSDAARIDAILQDCGVEGELGARGIHTLATTARSRLEDLVRTEQERDGAYEERAHLVALLAAMTEGAVIAPAEDVEEPGWQIVYLFIRGGQASWHISPRDAHLFEDVEHVPVDDPRAQWDGHTTEAKYERIRRHTQTLARQCGPACSEAHTETGRCEIARNR